MVDVVWHGIDVEGLERVRLESVGGPGADAGVRAASVVDSARGRFEYELELGPGWSFRSLRVASTAARGSLELTRSADGEWRADGARRSDLEEAVDLDLAMSPLTNSLPIRRLRLEVGDSADLVMAFVDAELEVFPDPQRYTRLDEHRYLFESLDSDVEAELTVDGRGLVVDYPGLFERG